MVQTVEEKAELDSRFRMVELVRTLKHRREKQTNMHSPGSWAIRRRLFSNGRNDLSSKVFALAKFREMYERKKSHWNYDFERDCPADLPNHKFVWQPVVAAENGEPAPSNSAPAQPKKVKQTSIAEFLNIGMGTKLNRVEKKSDAAPGKSSVDNSQKKLSDFLQVRKSIEAPAFKRAKIQESTNTTESAITVAPQDENSGPSN